MRCFSRDPDRTTKKGQRGWLGKGNLAPRFPAASTCCYCSVCCLLAGATSVLLHLSVLVPCLLSAASPALALPFSSRFPFQDPTALLGHVLLGNLASFSPWDSSSGEAHYANQSWGQHLTCTVWLRKVRNSQCIFQALVQVSTEGLIPKVLLQLLVRDNQISLHGWHPDVQIYHLFKSMEVQDECNTSLSFVHIRSPSLELTNSE